MFLMWILRNYFKFGYLVVIFRTILEFFAEVYLVKKKQYLFGLLCLILVASLEYWMNKKPICILNLFASQEQLSEAYILLGSESVFTDSQLEILTENELYIIRNGIFAYCGRIFNEENLMEIFTDYNWYNPRYPPEDFKWEMLNPIQQKNIIKIKNFEQKEFE